MPVRALMSEDGIIVALIKPQFEAGREKVGKKGVVRDIKTHYEVIEKVAGFARANGFVVAGLDFSPIKGPEGNIEYLVYLRMTDNESYPSEINEIIKIVVDMSHQTL